MSHSLQAFLAVAANSHFSLHNLPYVVFSLTHDQRKRVGTIVGEYVIDLALLEQQDTVKQNRATYTLGTRTYSVAVCE